MDKLEKSLTRLKEGSRMRPLVLNSEVLTFLDHILKPKRLPHNASLADFVRNETLREVSEIIYNAHARGGY